MPLRQKPAQAAIGWERGCFGGEIGRLISESSFSAFSASSAARCEDEIDDRAASPRLVRTRGGCPRARR